MYIFYFEILVCAFTLISTTVEGYENASLTSVTKMHCVQCLAQNDDSLSDRMPGQKHKTISPLSDQNSPKKQRDTSGWTTGNSLHENETLRFADDEPTSSEQSQGASGGIDIDHPISDALRLNRQTLDETASHEQVDSLMDVQNHD